MDFKNIETKWKKYWEDNSLHTFNKKNISNKHYVLEMFSYPSGSNLHLGHWYNYGPTDSYARFKKMQGFDVFQPMGFDAFGLPAENFAIKTGIHPLDSTMKNIATMERQLKDMGAMFDWSAELYTCSPDYYKWTQWIFLQLYKNGLAYQKKSPVNWCGSCNTVIANEQVLDGNCERCGTQIIKKEMTQWFFKITDYAEELLSCLDTLDWPEKTKAMQRNWIGKSVGGEVEFKLENNETFRVFTTRADTLFGVSYVVLAPELPLVDKITTADCKSAVEKYKLNTSKIDDIERMSGSLEKTGVFTGSYCINPINGKKVPIWIADYCLANYGTGAVMGVPAHDTRDFDFAKKYNLPISRVIRANESVNDDLPFTEYGLMVNSGSFDGLTTGQGKTAVLKTLSEMNRGGEKINYRLRDWSVSRQRYWGAPIPIIHCPKCGNVAVEEKNLPVELPYNVNFTPDGRSPLGKCEEFMNVTCPKCGASARRDPDTLDTFVCSSWYHLRYPDNKNSEKPFDSEYINKMLPVDKYVGGAEHACMHLLYSRFITKALRDLGYLNFSEPFTSLIHQGLILGADGNKMSKSKGNVVNPDIYIDEFGSDIFRLYLMFGFSYIEGGPWNDDGIKAIAKFIDRVERIVMIAKSAKTSETTEITSIEKELNYALHYAIKNITTDIESFSFNTAIARIMELVNALYKYDNFPDKKPSFLKSVVLDLIKLLAPFTPHICEEFNQLLGGENSIFLSKFPVVNEKMLIKDEIEMAIQVNSKIKVRIMMATNLTENEIEKLILSDAKIIEALEGKSPKKIIIIPNRLINIIA